MPRFVCSRSESDAMQYHDAHGCPHTGISAIAGESGIGLFNIVDHHLEGAAEDNASFRSAGSHSTRDILGIAAY